MKEQELQQQELNCTEEELISKIKKLMLETTTKFLELGDNLNKLKERNEVSFRNLVEWGNGYSYASLFRFMKIAKEYEDNELRNLARALGVRKSEMILKIDDKSKRLTFIKQTFYDTTESTTYNVNKTRMSCNDLKEKIDLFNINNNELNKVERKLSEKRVISSLSNVLDKQVAKINELYSNKILTGDQIELQLKLQELKDLIDRINDKNTENNAVGEIKESSTENNSTEESDKDNL